MQAKNAYLEQCVDTMQFLSETGQLDGLKRGQEIGRSRTFATFSIGKVALQNGEELWLAVKQPLAREGVVGRLQAELPVFASLAEHDSTLHKKLPRLLGCLSVNNYRQTYLLTEDVSQGGRHVVSAEYMSEGLFETIQAALAPSDASLREEARYYMTFQADERERILDGTPSPFRSSPGNLSALRQAVAEQRKSLTISTVDSL